MDFTFHGFCAISDLISSARFSLVARYGTRRATYALRQKRRHAHVFARVYGHRLQELGQVPRNAAERPQSATPPSPGCAASRMRCTISWIKPGVDAVENHHAVTGVRSGCLTSAAGSSGPVPAGSYGHRRLRRRPVRPQAPGRSRLAAARPPGLQAPVLHGYRVPAPGGQEVGQRCRAPRW